MKKTQVKEKLKELNYPIETIPLGTFDVIGEYTAKKSRDRNHPLYHSVGCFFRPNYERGILLYALIKNYKINSYLEIGFGRGYSAFCAAMALHDAGLGGKITVIEPFLDENHIENMRKIFPKEWFDMIEFKKMTSDAFFFDSKEKYDLIYIDGDHRKEAVQRDWDNSSTRYNKLVLFDDYHLPTKNEKDIEVRDVVDNISLEKELIITDRRIFLDDRGLKDDEIDYGQVIIKHPDFNDSEYNLSW